MIHEHLKLTTQTTAVDTHMEKQIVRIIYAKANHRIIKMGGGHLHGDGRLLNRDTMSSS